MCSKDTSSTPPRGVTKRREMVIEEGERMESLDMVGSTSTK